MKCVTACFLLIVLAGKSYAQLDSARRDSLQTLELQIQGQALIMLNDRDENTRQTTAYFMVKNLVRAFKIPGSFHYPFDSVKSLSILYPPDRSFRLITFHLVMGDGAHRQYGIIQLNPDKVKRKKKGEEPKLLYPLIDRSDSISKPEQEVLEANRWWGAHYYAMIPVKVKRKQYYTLLGIDGYTVMANRKVADVLWFEKDGSPRFGAPLFDNTEPPQPQQEKTREEGYHPEVKLPDETKAKQADLNQRVVFLYDNEAIMTMRYSEKEKSIFFDHLIPKDGKSVEMKYNYVPDGTFDYYRWEKDRWKLYRNYADSKIPAKGEPGKTE